jgi:hypothetical protein
MNKKTIFIIVGVVVVLCCCLIGAIVAVSSLGVFGGLAGTQPAVDVGDKFMNSLKDGNYDAAFATLHPALQQKIGNAQGLKRMVESGKAQPTKWSYSSRSVNNDTASLEGTASMLGGNGTLSIELLKSGDVWKITSFDLSAK